MHAVESVPILTAFLPLIFLMIFLLIFALAIAGTAFWIWMIIDCVQNEPSPGNDRIAWLLLLIFTHLLGAVIYFFVRRRPRRRLRSASSTD